MDKNFIVARNRDGKPKRGEVTRWLEEIALCHEGDSCLTFPFFRDKLGYARLGGRGPGLAHVYVLEKTKGAKPSLRHEGCHSCGNGHLGCVNPHHLYWGTRVQNMADRKAHGVDVPPPRLIGAANFKTKLTEPDVQEIRRLLAAGVAGNKIAATFGIAPGTVCQIKQRRSWAWLG